MFRPRSVLAGLLCVVAFVAAGCNINKYQLGGEGEVTIDAGDDDDPTGGGDGGGGGTDAGTDAPGCVAVAESCNNRDDDCDTMVDEGIDLTMNPNHCGACNRRCQQPNAAGTCSNSECSYTCLPGWVDRDNNTTNGCDYFCTPTNNGVEVCDLADNDCDGNTDENVDLNTVENCGRCGNVCRALHAEPTCNQGTCGRGPCDVGYADVVPAIAGCEYQCPVFPTQAESCNNVDDDCDGNVDEGQLAGIGGSCTHPDYTAQGETGECTFGTVECRFGAPVCVGYEGPSSETCNELDDDCDGTADDGFDKMNDPRYCGGCTACSLPNAVAGCSMGACTVAACQSGFTNQDGNPANGCEYACTPSGPEVCDGRDNDCDRQTDENLTPPSNFCRTQGACAGAAPTCGPDPCNSNVTAWQCPYGANTEATCGDLPFQEARCDGIDGDCDGRTDEAFPTLTSACADDGIGACRGTGTVACSADHTGVTCNITSPGAAPTSEVCDGIDNNCNGQLDEGAPDSMVQVTQGATTFYVYAYEASRPDAALNDFGSLEHRACSRPGVLPWRNVTYNEAAAACAAAGRRLCTESEWQLACEGLTGRTYPYGDAYIADACNGRDNDPNCTLPNDDSVVATATRHGCPAPAQSRCISPFGAYDMSGNLREWTSTQVGTNSFRVRGGAFDNVAEGLTCDLSFISLAPTFAFPNLGFRCCSTTP